MDGGSGQSAFPVNRFGNHNRRRPLAANFNLNQRASFRELRFHISEADSNSQRRALRATCDFSDLGGAIARAPDWIMRSRWRGFVCHFESDTLSARTFFFLPGQ